MFFLSIEENHEPIGFVRVPSPVTTLKWSLSKKKKQLTLLVCCEDGSMVEVEGPVKGEYNTSMTYHLDPLKFTIRKFVSIKDRLRVGSLVQAS